VALGGYIILYVPSAQTVEELRDAGIKIALSKVHIPKLFHCAIYVWSPIDRPCISELLCVVEKPLHLIIIL